MRLTRVLIHLLLLIAAAPFAASAATDPDDIFLSTAGRTCFRNILRESSWGLAGPNERAAFIVEQSDGSFTCEEWPSRHSYLSESFYGAIPAHAVAIAHTHPVQYPKPSLQDKKEATRLGMPIYVITIRGVYKALPGNDRVATIAEHQNWIRQVPSTAAITPKTATSASP
jgi:hypothetical protein